MEVVVTTGLLDTISRAKLQSDHHQQQTNTQFLQAGCPSCRPTNGVKTLKGKYHIPSSPGVFQLCRWPLIAPGYLGRGLPCLSSALWCQYPSCCTSNNNNNNHHQISTVPYGRNFRGTGGRSDQCSVKAWLNRTVLSLDLKTDWESLLRTVCGSEFQTDTLYTNSYVKTYSWLFCLSVQPTTETQLSSDIWSNSLTGGGGGGALEVSGSLKTPDIGCLPSQSGESPPAPLSLANCTTAVCLMLLLKSFVIFLFICTR